MSDMNPHIATVKVGIKSLREVTVYPLSAASQLKLGKVLSGIMVTFSKIEKMDETKVAEFILGVIEENISKILEFVIDPTESLSLDELTNPQITEIAEIIWTVNYEGSIKKCRALVNKAKSLFQKTQETPKTPEK